MRLSPFAVVLFGVATPAGAHAFGARYDLPLPLEYYLIAAGLAVGVSFLGAVLFLRAGAIRVLRIEIAIPYPLARAVVVGLRLVGIAIVVVLLGAAFSGPAVATENFATVFVWVIWWVGFLLLSMLIVTIWPVVDPARTLFVTLSHLRQGGLASSHKPLARAAGYLAPLGLLALAWIELVSDWSENPRALGIIVSIYLATTFAAASRYGMAWFCVADPLGRLFELVGRMAIIRPAKRSGVTLGLPGESLLENTTPRSGETLMVCVLIGVVLFDGLSETPPWAAVLTWVSESLALRDTLLTLREHGVDLLKLVRTLGLLTVVLGFFCTYVVLVFLMRYAALSDRPVPEIAAIFASTLLPIAAAYHLSHYISYLMIAGQLIGPAASDPFALGWNLFGMANRSIDISVIGARHVWWISMGALITGHSLSVLIAHRRALQVFGDQRQASRSQIPMMIAMVCLTVVSLWILSQPITE